MPPTFDIRPSSLDPSSGVDPFSTAGQVAARAAASAARASFAETGYVPGSYLASIQSRNQRNHPAPPGIIALNRVVNDGAQSKESESSVFSSTIGGVLNNPGPIHYGGNTFKVPTNYPLCVKIPASNAFTPMSSNFVGIRPTISNASVTYPPPAISVPPMGLANLQQHLPTISNSGFTPLLPITPIACPARPPPPLSVPPPRNALREFRPPPGKRQRQGQGEGEETEMEIVRPASAFHSVSKLISNSNDPFISGQTVVSNNEPEEVVDVEGLGESAGVKTNSSTGRGLRVQFHDDSVNECMDIDSDLHHLKYCVLCGADYDKRPDELVHHLLLHKGHRIVDMLTQANQVLFQSDGTVKCNFDFCLEVFSDKMTWVLHYSRFHKRGFGTIFGMYVVKLPKHIQIIKPKCIGCQPLARTSRMMLKVIQGKLPVCSICYAYLKRECVIDRLRRKGSRLQYAVENGLDLVQFARDEHPEITRRTVKASVSAMTQFKMWKEEEEGKLRVLRASRGNRRFARSIDR